MDYLAFIPPWIWIAASAACAHLFFGFAVTNYCWHAGKWDYLCQLDKQTTASLCVALWPVFLIAICGMSLGKWLAEPQRPKVFQEPDEIMKEKKHG